MKRILSILVAAALVMGAFSLAPVRAQEAPEDPAVPEVPEEPNVTDPAGDANYLNDQANGADASGQTTPADASTVADILAAWFTTDKDNISLHIQTEAPAPGTQALFFRGFADPGTDEGCLEFEAITSGAGGPSQGNALLDDVCAEEAVRTEGVLTTNELEDGTGVLTMTIPRSASDAFADGSVLKPVTITSRNYVGLPPGLPYSGVTAPQIDLTEEGIEYTVDAGEVKPPKKPKKPKAPKKPKKLTKKACKKLDGKAEKKCLKKLKKNAKPKPKVCKPYVPGEEGADAEMSVITDEATEEAPVEVTLPTEPGLGTVFNGQVIGEMPHVFHNIQVDPAAKETGLWVRVEIPERTDYDIYLKDAEGTEVARASGFNPLPHEQIGDGTGNGGHSEETAEQLDGIKSADCTGYTLDIANATGPGGDVTVKMWLGEANYDPAAPPE